MDGHCLMNVSAKARVWAKCVFTVIMLTSMQCVHMCVCVQESSRVSFSGCISVCQSVRVSSVYKTLGVGVCSCVYSACPEIVTELHKQFTVNKPFPYSNKGPMRLNSVPHKLTSCGHEKHDPWPTKALCSTSLFYHIRLGPPFLQHTQPPISLGTWMCRKMFLRETESNNLSRNVLLLERQLTNEQTGWCNGGPLVNCHLSKSCGEREAGG